MPYQPRHGATTTKNPNGIHLYRCWSGMLQQVRELTAPSVANITLIKGLPFARNGWPMRGSAIGPWQMDTGKV